MPLNPDKTTTINGVKVNEYLLTKHNPNHIDMPTANLPAKPLGITVHNTDWINVASNTTPAEQYTRACVNGNLKSVRVHYYVDDKCAWQNLPLTLSGFHAADGNGPGNRKTISIECIMRNSTDSVSKKSEDNCAKLTAWLLHKYGLNVEDNLFTHTHWLNVRDGVTGSNDYLNTKKHPYKYCLPVDSTELLTPNGWKSLKDITENDLIAQYDNGIITFVNPIAIVEPYEAEVLKTRYLEATGNHRMLVSSYGSKKKKYQDKTWEEILDSTTAYRMNTSGLLEGELNLSDDELLLLAWIQGDGHYMKNKNGEIMGIEFHLKKQRKINRIHFLLKEMDINYSDSWCENGTIHIRIYDKSIYDWAETWLENKEFTYKLLPMSMEQFKIFSEELFIIDGHKNERQRMYTSSSLNNLDFVQALCATHNARSSECTLGTSKKHYGDQPACVNFLKTNASFVKNDNIEKRNTLVSCVTVPSSYILIRQNLHTFVVGNCPYYILPHWAQFKSKVATYLAQLNGSKVPSTPTSTQMYRIRKTWADSKSQIGAYSNLENAKKACKSGYTVFDNNGNAVYTNGGASKPTTAPNITYCVYANKWYPAVVNDSDYAGVENRSISGFAAKTNKGTLKYRVHTHSGRWLGWVTGYNTRDWNNGCAGIRNRAIDAIQLKLEGVSGYEVQYRVSYLGTSAYLPWVTGTSDYAGIFNKTIDKIQIRVVKV